MKTIRLATLAALLLPSMTACAQTPPAVTPHQLEWSVTQQHKLAYLQYLPPGYDTNSAQRWPLLLFLHGAGERGTDVQRVAIHGPLREVKRGTNLPFIVLAPQCPEGQVWDQEALLRLLGEATQSLRVDTNRIYLTGLSMGGYASWKLGVTRPELFAAIAPICGGGSLIDVLLGSRERGAALRTLPVWAFHGAKDPVVPLDESERIIAQLKRMGVTDVKLTVYPDAQHDSWTETYSNPEFYTWLLSKERKPATGK